MTNYQSDSLTSLIPALIKAQVKLEVAEKTRKSGSGEKGSRSWKYADWPTIVEASRKALEQNGLCVVQRLIENEQGTLLSTLLLHTSGEYIDSHIKLLITPASTPQAVGGCITYFKRYAYAALVGVVTDEEDDDGERASKEYRDYNSTKKSLGVLEAPPKNVLSTREIQLLEEELADLPKIKESILDHFNISSIKDLPTEAFLPAIRKIRKIVAIEGAK